MARQVLSPRSIADAAARQVRGLRRPTGDFDARRYFRGTKDLGFYNVGTPAIRRLAADLVREHLDDWSVDDALAVADQLIAVRFLEVKQLAVEVVARYRRDFVPRLLPHWQRWLAAGHSDNWATTDAICGLLVSPLLVAHPALIAHTRTWTRHRNPWVRRASAVSLVGLARRGQRLDDAYAVAGALRADTEDLIQKAVGWLLREAGKTNPTRLERYLLVHGRTIARTTVRYAIERFPPARRRELPALTKAKCCKVGADRASGERPLNGVLAADNFRYIQWAARGIPDFRD